VPAKYRSSVTPTVNQIHPQLPESVVKIFTMAAVPFIFMSLAATIAGDLYFPSGNGPFPTVITAPGFGGVKRDVNSRMV